MRRHLAEPVACRAWDAETDDEPCALSVRLLGPDDTPGGGTDTQVQIVVQGLERPLDLRLPGYVLAQLAALEAVRISHVCQRINGAAARRER